HLTDHGGWRREQWVARASMETGTPAVGRRGGGGDRGVALSSRGEEVGQERTSPLLPHQPELAPGTPREPRGECPPHFGHHDQDGRAGRVPTGSALLPGRAQGLAKGHGGDESTEGHLPRRVELHYSSKPAKVRQLFHDGYLLATYGVDYDQTPAEDFATGMIT